MNGRPDTPGSWPWGKETTVTVGWERVDGPQFWSGICCEAKNPAHPEDQAGIPQPVASEFANWIVWMNTGAVIACLTPLFNICLNTLMKTKEHPASGPRNELRAFRYKALGSAVQW